MLYSVLIFGMFISQSTSSSKGIDRTYPNPPILLPYKDNSDKAQENNSNILPFLQNDEAMEEYFREALALYFSHRPPGPKEKYFGKSLRSKSNSQNAKFLRQLFESVRSTVRDVNKLLRAPGSNILVIGEKYEKNQNPKLKLKDLTDADRYIDVEQENQASEVMDKLDSSSSDENGFRRACDDNAKDSKSSDSGEENPGNPYTVIKNRYKQNWPWNFEMTGDHVNLNPNAPGFAKYQDDGTSVFFARKWWYFNQDDFIPI